MSNIKILLCAAAALLGASAVANATTIYATNVDNYTEGTGVTASRSDPTAALGNNTSTFVSLGLGGSLTVDFGRTFMSPGSAVEITYGGGVNYPETADVYLAGANGVFGGIVASLTNSSSLNTFHFSGGPFTFLKLVDTTKTTNPNSPSVDGYDVAAIGVSPVPIPAAGFLLLSAFGGLAALRRRKRA